MTFRAAAYIGLGANLVRDHEPTGHPAQTMAAAVCALEDDALSVDAVSSLYCSAPLGPVTDQPLFFNAVVRVVTDLDPRRLLRRCLAVERQLGRRRRGAQPKGPRVIDLDLLLWEREVGHWPELELPHPELVNRAFVVWPLVELAPLVEDPRDGTPLVDLLPELLGDQAIEKVHDPSWVS